jgi:hypothetical protein
LTQQAMQRPQPVDTGRVDRFGEKISRMEPQYSFNGYPSATPVNPALYAPAQPAQQVARPSLLQQAMGGSTEAMAGLNRDTTLQKGLIARAINGDTSAVNQMQFIPATSKLAQALAMQNNNNAAIATRQAAGFANQNTLQDTRLNTVPASTLAQITAKTQEGDANRTNSTTNTVMGIDAANGRQKTALTTVDANTQAKIAAGVQDNSTVPAKVQAQINADSNTQAKAIQVQLIQLKASRQSDYDTLAKAYKSVANQGDDVGVSYIDRKGEIQLTTKGNLGELMQQKSNELNQINELMAPQASQPAPGAGVPPPASQPTDPLDGKTATGPNGQKIVRKNGTWIPLP